MLALLLALALTSTPDCTAVDARGDSFPTCFDPGRGLELGAGAAARTTGSAGSGAAFEVSGALLWRTARESRSREGSLWIVEHRFLSTRAKPGPDLRELRATAWDATFRRHVRDGFILVPTARPRRLPFPFDLAVSVRAGTWERRVYDGPGGMLEVARAALLLDPVRSSSGRVRLGLGPSMSYTARTAGEGFTHELSPFASALLDAGWESADGWWSTRLQALGGWVVVPGEETFLRARAEGRLERLVFAVNDQPLWLSLGANAAYRDAGAHRTTELQGSLGLVWRPFN